MVSLGGHSDWLLNSLVVRNSHFLMRVANSKIVIVWQNALRFTARSQFTAWSHLDIYLKFFAFISLQIWCLNPWRVTLYLRKILYLLPNSSITIVVFNQNMVWLQRRRTELLVPTIDTWLLLYFLIGVTIVNFVDWRVFFLLTIGRICLLLETNSCWRNFIMIARKTLTTIIWSAVV